MDFHEVVRGMWRRKSAVIGLVLILILCLFTAFPSWLAPRSPLRQDMTMRLQPPGSDYPFGTDNYGRCILSRLIHGARISGSIALISVAIASVGGVLLGLLAGYYGGLIDQTISMVIDVMLVFPAILLGIAIVALLGVSFFNISLAIAIPGIPRFARITRGAVWSMRESEFVLSAKALGAGDIRVMTRHVLANCMAPIMVMFTVRIATAILAESTLGFLGLGIQPPTPSWGAMISEGRAYLQFAPWVPMAPGLVIMMAVLGFNLVGDGLRDVLDPKLRGSQ